jgi:hypothetical protein
MELYTNFAYIVLYAGPGMAGGVIAVLFGVLFAFFLSLIAIFWYPTKKMIHFIKSITRNK